ncbi:MAG: GDP-mannose 4,6-dehydratase [Ardenticatenales bacterium]|nr:GDP-mannose 4,6-dehydratase [Ardenticatenales bacterium]
MKNILVTGGAGFIGANFVIHMIEKYGQTYNLVVFDNLTYAGNLDNLLEVSDETNYAFVRGDICDAEAVEQAITEHNIDTIVNFSAFTHVDRSILDPEECMHANFMGTYRLLEAARRHGNLRLNQVSSVTGDTPLLVRDEETGKISLRAIETLDGEDITRYSVLTMTDDYRVTFQQMRHFIKHPANEVYEITYNGGGRIRATASHSVFIFEEGEIIAKPSSDLKVGDLMVTFVGEVDIERQTHVFNMEDILADYSYQGMDESLIRRQNVVEALTKSPQNITKLQQLLEGSISSATTLNIANQLADDGYLEKTSGGVYSLTTDTLIGAYETSNQIWWDLVRRKLHIERKTIPVTPLLMEIFGLYLAEGHCSHTPAELEQNSRQVTFTIGATEHHALALLRRCAEDEFNIKPYVRERESTFQVSYSSYWVHALFAQFGATAESKHLPYWIWTQPPELIAAFLRGYEGDAAIKGDGRRYFTTVNRELAHNLSWLARMNDINCSFSTRIVQQIKGKVPPNCTVTRKREFYDLQVSSENYRADESGAWRTPMARCIPTQSIVKALNCRQNKGVTVGYKELSGKVKAQALAATFEETPEDLVRLINSSIGVAKIKNIQRIDGTVMVYDVSVPGNEKFFGGNMPALLHNTDEVYGHIHGDHESTEQDPLVPRSPYSASKAGADLLVHAYHITYGLPATITRGANNIGPYQYPEKVVPLFVTNALQGKPLPVYGDGRQMRDYQYVRDHCEGIDLVLHEGAIGETYNIGTGHEMENLRMVEILLDEMGLDRSLIQFVEDRAGHDRRYSMDVSKIKALGWQPRHTCEEAIRKTVRWYLANEWWWRKVRNEVFESYYQKQYGTRKVLRTESK